MGLLALAGMVSGAGEGLGKAAQQAMSHYGASQLQKERDAMEMRRLELMEDNATAREVRGQEFQRGLQQERIGADLLNRSLERDHSDSVLDKSQGFTREETEKTRRQHRDDQAQALELAQATLAQGDQRLANDKAHQDATIKLAQAQLQAQKDEVSLQPLGDGTYMRINAQGEVLGRAVDPDTNTPLQGTKDLSATTKLMVDINKTMIQFKGEQLKNPGLLPDERSAINGDIDRLKQNIEQLLGMAPEKKGPVQIIDPAAKSPAGPESTIAKPPPTPAPGAEEYLAQLRADADQRAAALKVRTQTQGQAAMDASNPSSSSVQTAAVPRKLPRAAAPSGMIAKADPMQQFETNQPANFPRELDRATPQPEAPAPVAQQPDIVDPKQAELQVRTTPGQPAATFALTGQPDAPRRGMLAKVQEPDILDPDGTQAAEEGMEPAVTDFEGIQALRDADTLGTEEKIQPARRTGSRPISPDNLRSLLTRDQRREIIDMRERIVKPGITEKPATPGQLQDLLLEILGPLYRDNGQGPGDLADGVIHMMDTLLPESAARK